MEEKIQEIIQVLRAYLTDVHFKNYPIEGDGYMDHIMNLVTLHDEYIDLLHESEKRKQGATNGK